MLAREPHERQVAFVQVAHGRHERHRARGGAGAAQGLDVARDLHQPTLSPELRWPGRHSPQVVLARHQAKLVAPA